MKSEETLLWEAVANVKERELAELYWLLRKSPEWTDERDPEVFKNREKNKKEVKHTITVSPSTVYGRPFLVSCSCGLLHMDTSEEEIGQLMKIHWNWIKQQG